MSTERKKVLQAGDSELPPPGDERREELKRRQDDLEEKAEKVADEQEVYAMDPKAMEVDRELAQKYDRRQASMLSVSNQQPGWEYSWANYVNQAGLQVMMKKYDGWIVVSGSDKECIEHKDADGTRRVGDVLLMKIPKEKKAILDKRDHEKRERIERGVAGELEELGRKYRGKGLKVHTPNTETSPHGFERQQVTYDPRRRLVEKQASTMLGEMSREKIPGVPLPGEGK